MIIQKEIQRIANELKIQPSVIDKDWVLGHFLNAMFELEEISKNFVFKGGTCLKKCYFNDYRYSEDLDFTLVDAGFVVDKLLFNRIISIAERNSGAKFHLKNIKSQRHNDVAQGYEVTILFWGADHKPNQSVLPVERWQTKIKVDLSFSEKILLTPQISSIFHSYSDEDLIKSEVSIYSLNEIIAEKLRSLLQRNRPRDIYDLFYLSQGISCKQHIHIYELLKQKSVNKGIYSFNKNDFVNTLKYKKNERAWESSLGHHLAIGKLVEFELAYKTVEYFIADILKIKQ